MAVSGPCVPPGDSFTQHKQLSPGKLQNWLQHYISVPHVDPDSGTGVSEAKVLHTGIYSPDEVAEAVAVGNLSD